MTSTLSNFSVASVSSLIASTSASQQVSAPSVSYSELPISIATLAKVDPLVQHGKDGDGPNWAPCCWPAGGSCVPWRFSYFTSYQDLCTFLRGSFERQFALGASDREATVEVYWIRTDKSAPIRNPLDLLSHDVFLNKIVFHLYLLDAEAMLGACSELPYVSASSPEPSSRRTICRPIRTKSSPVLQGHSRPSPASPADRPPNSSSCRPQRRTSHPGA